MRSPEEVEHLLRRMNATGLHVGIRGELEHLAKNRRFADMIEWLNVAEQIAPQERAVVQDIREELPSIVRRAGFGENDDFDMEQFQEDNFSPPPRTIIPGQTAPEPDPTPSGPSWDERIRKASRDPDRFDREVRAIERPYLKSLKGTKSE